MGLTEQEQEQEQRHEWFREHWAHGIPFNQHCGIEVRRWDDEAVELFLPYAEVLSAHAGIFHGGVVSALLDTTATGAVMAGHDFAKGSRLTTISLSVQYLSVAPGEDLLATGWCTRRGRSGASPGRHQSRCSWPDRRLLPSASPGAAISFILKARLNLG